MDLVKESPFEGDSWPAGSGPKNESFKVLCKTRMIREIRVLFVKSAFYSVKGSVNRIVRCSVQEPHKNVLFANKTRTLLLWYVQSFIVYLYYRSDSRRFGNQ